MKLPSVRKNQGRTGQKAENVLDSFDRAVELKRKASLHPQQTTGPKAVGEDLGECFRQMEEQFPQECLVYSDSAARAREYSLFEEMSKILMSMNKDRVKFKNKARFHIFVLA